MADVALDLADELGLTDTPAGTTVAVTGLSVMDLSDTPSTVGYDVSGASRMRLSDATARTITHYTDRVAADTMSVLDEDIPVAADVAETLGDDMDLGDVFAVVAVARRPGLLTAGTLRGPVFAS